MNTHTLEIPLAGRYLLYVKPFPKKKPGPKPKKRGKLLRKKLLKKKTSR